MTPTPRLISLPIVCSACSGHNPRTQRARPSRRTSKVKTNAAYIAHTITCTRTDTTHTRLSRNAGSPDAHAAKPHQAASGNITGRSTDPSPIAINPPISMRPFLHGHLYAASATARMPQPITTSPAPYVMHHVPPSQTPYCARPHSSPLTYKKARKRVPKRTQKRTQKRTLKKILKKILNTIQNDLVTE